MSVGTSVEGKRAHTKEIVDISSGKSEDNYYGCPIEEEGNDEKTAETGAREIFLSVVGILET